MPRPQWVLLTTLSDAVSAQALLDILSGEGIAARVLSDAGVLGQAAPCRIVVDAAQLRQARWALAQRRFSDEELASFAIGQPDEGGR